MADNQDTIIHSYVQIEFPDKTKHWIFSMATERALEEHHTDIHEWTYDRLERTMEMVLKKKVAYKVLREMNFIAPPDARPKLSKCKRGEDTTAEVKNSKPKPKQEKKQNEIF